MSVLPEGVVNHVVCQRSENTVILDILFAARCQLDQRYNLLPGDWLGGQPIDVGDVLLVATYIEL